MIEAQRKRKENIIEYILYMWQVEDLLRACRFDTDEIERHIISRYAQPENIRQTIRQWYAELTDMMRSESIMEKGHIRIVKNVVAELADLHVRLLKSPQETVYGALYCKTLPAIVQLRAQSGGGNISEIETCLTGVYGYLLLKIQGREISAGTSDSVRQISALLTFLSAKYHEENTLLSCSN